MAHHLLVVGGNGFLGSAVCKAALAKGWTVTSLSKSGSPYRTPSGHAPEWTSRVAWNAGSAGDPPAYAHLLSGVTAVVHTLGVLLEGNYKSGISGALSALRDSHSPNPLRRGGPGSYEAVNRDSALAVLDAFMKVPNASRRTFAYVSAADIFRPLIPERYITTKREAEAEIATRTQEQEGTLRALYFRPGLMYHPHLRPLTTPAASLLDLSASLSSCVPKSLPSFRGFLRSLPLRGSTTLPPASHSIASALETRPMHVDSVARAICVAVEAEGVEGVVDVNRMRELIGWENRGGFSAPLTESEPVRTHS